VRNDVVLGPGRRLLVVSGSNMSGKSTLLRAIGANAALAQAGAPVCARALRMSRVQIGASVQLRDSLLGGQSRFYAEIRRLRLVYELAAADAPPVLFLLDEILHGTNAQERRVGAEAVIRGLLERGAFGLVTTHDLALAEMVERVGDGAANVHFEDRVEQGELHFDYRLRPGVARQGNALALMRELGLPV
jgi:DNA mismatch repair ATPase MutS